MNSPLLVMLSQLCVMWKKTTRKILPSEILGARSARKEGFLSDFVGSPSLLPAWPFFSCSFLWHHAQRAWSTEGLLVIWEKCKFFHQGCASYKLIPYKTSLNFCQDFFLKFLWKGGKSLASQNTVKVLCHPSATVAIKTSETISDSAECYAGVSVRFESSAACM